jgi:hypothetical protein
LLLPGRGGRRAGGWADGRAGGALAAATHAPAAATQHCCARYNILVCVLYTGVAISAQGAVTVVECGATRRQAAGCGRPARADQQSWP